MTPSLLHFEMPPETEIECAHERAHAAISEPALCGRGAACPALSFYFANPGWYWQVAGWEPVWPFADETAARAHFAACDTLQVRYWRRQLGKRVGEQARQVEALCADPASIAKRDAVEQTAARIAELVRALTESIPFPDSDGAAVAADARFDCEHGGPACVSCVASGSARFVR